MSQLCPPSGQGALIGTAQDLGLIDPSRRGRAAEGITLKVFKENGEEAGRVVSFDNQGQFIICDLPLLFGCFQSLSNPRDLPEDSGTFLVTAYPDGVTVVSIDVNKALPRETSFRGQVQNLAQPEGAINMVGDVRLSVLGTQNASLQTLPAGLISYSTATADSLSVLRKRDISPLTIIR
ncbi:MAG: hypothetical protein MPW14_07835 [Candidatus Manganitrophus sp.]|nr:MAG: hypothetical protein MPW14_07835 [Candidatus Manganitrophus sp.]